MNSFSTLEIFAETTFGLDDFLPSPAAKAKPLWLDNESNKEPYEVKISRTVLSRDSKSDLFLSYVKLLEYA